MREKKADIKACTSSVPAKGILSSNRGGDVGSSSRARSAVVAVASTGAAICAHITAHQRTTHEGRASVAGVLHARRTLVGAHGAGAAVRLLLALVAAGNDKHGTTIEGSKTDGTNGNTSGLGLLGRGLVIRAGSAKGIVARASSRRSTIITTSGARAATSGTGIIDLAKDANLGVDLGGQAANNGVGVVVDDRVGNRHVQLKLINEVLGVVDDGQSSDITPLSTGIVRNKFGNLNLFDIDTSGVGKSLRQVLEDLGGSNGVAGNKHVVERIQESNLDGLCAFGSRSVGVVRVDDLGNIGWQRGGGGDRLSRSRRSPRICGGLNHNGCRQPVSGIGQGSGWPDASDGLGARG